MAQSQESKTDIKMEEKEADMCLICRDELPKDIANDLSSTVNCTNKHRYHSECITEWQNHSTSKRSCPLCHGKIPFLCKIDEIKKHEVKAEVFHRWRILHFSELETHLPMIFDIITGNFMRPEEARQGLSSYEIMGMVNGLLTTIHVPSIEADELPIRLKLSEADYVNFNSSQSEQRVIDILIYVLEPYFEPPSRN